MSNQAKSLHLSEYIVEWLEELREEYDQGNKSEFMLGEIYAYVEVLEVILKKHGIDNDSLLDIEKRYGIR